MAKAKPNTPAKKVWHITRWKQRFELPDDIRHCRQTALMYVRLPVGSRNGDDDLVLLVRQLDELQARPDGLACLGAFCQLLRQAGGLSQIYRGYLLDARLRPAKPADIARWWAVGAKQATAMLSVLEKVGLIERMDLPSFDQIEPTKPKRRTSRKSKPSAHGGARARTAAHGRARAPLKNKGEGKSKEQAQGQTAALTGSGKAGKSKKKINPDGDRPTKLKVHTQGHVVEIEGEPQNKPAATGSAGPPTATPDPINPTDPDAGQEGRQASTKPIRRSPPASSVPVAAAGLYDARQFAISVYEALGLPGYPKPQADELANFRTAWELALSAGIPWPALAGLWDKSISQAAKLARKPAQAFRKSRGAVWRQIFNRRFEHAKGIHYAAKTG